MEAICSSEMSGSEPHGVTNHQTIHFKIKINYWTLKMAKTDI
jgi:hypothetical protein